MLVMMSLYLLYNVFINVTLIEILTIKILSILLNVFLQHNCISTGEVSRVANGQVVEQNTDEKCSSSSSAKEDAVKKLPYQRQVTLRRDVSVMQQSEVEPARNIPVVELHINTDLTPTASSDFQLELLSGESGTAVERLRQFLEESDDHWRSSSVRRSSHNVPTAIQPGKAFDSLKYFLSTMDGVE